MKLAIVAPSFSAVSETFIADHVRTLAPGRTALVCRDGTGAEAYGCPVLSHVRPDFTAWGPLDRFAKTTLERIHRRIGPACGLQDRMRIAEFFRAQGVDRVLAEFGYSGVLVTEVCAAMDLPLHVYFRGMDATSTAASAAMRRRYRRMFRVARGVFCVSRHVADRVTALGCPPEKITVNPSGVVVEDFPPGSPEPGRVVAVGRLVDKKAPHLTLEAFARVAPRFPEATLDLVGDGPLEARCRETVAAHGLEGRVTLHGSLPHAEVARLMGRAAIFAQHSMTAPNGDMEGFPTAIAEAMSSGLCVVTTRHSGIPDHVRDGETGLTVAEGDVDGMAEALARALADPDAARRLGAAARAHALAHLDRARTRRVVREAMGLPEPA